jgi:hypothetical protein
MRAFIFSLDAFVAFTLALIAIYSLIFFSSVPSAYYYLLTQGHYLSRDSLLAISMTECTADYGSCKSPGASLLDNIVSENSGPAWAVAQKELIKSTVGPMVPRQFGYSVEISGDGGNTWSLAYDSGAAANQAGPDPDQHLALSDHRKLSVATQIITFGYSGRVSKLKTSPYYYMSCRGAGQMEGGLGSGGGSGSGSASFGLITCGEMEISNGDGTTSKKAFGNIYPSDILGVMGGGDLVPASDVELVKLTVYI